MRVRTITPIIAFCALYLLCACATTKSSSPPPDSGAAESAPQADDGRQSTATTSESEHQNSPKPLPKGPTNATDDFWLERTIYTSHWPQLLSRVEVVTDSARPVFLVDGQSMNDNSTFRLQVQLGEPAKRLRESPPPPRAPRSSARSPDGKYRAEASAGERIVLSLTDLATGATEVLLDDPYEGDWSIGEIVWSPTSRAFYFDNTGAVACIWRYDLSRRRLSKVVPAHEAQYPTIFVYDNMEQIAYVEGEWEQDYRLKTARSINQRLRRTLAQGAQTLSTLPLEWIALEKSNGQWVIEEYCEADPPRITIEPGASRLVFSYGMDAEPVQVSAALQTAIKTVSFVVQGPGGILTEAAELRYVSNDRAQAEFTCFTCAGEPSPRRFIEASHRQDVRVVKERCQ